MTGEARAASFEGVPVPLAALERAPLLDGLGAGGLRAVAAAMRLRTFAAGTTICREGEPADSMYVIVDGLVEARSVGHAARTQSLFAGLQQTSRLRRGDAIGATSLIAGEPRSATVAAALDTTALELGRDEFRALIARFPRLLENVVGILGRRLGAAAAAERRGEAVALLAPPGAVPEILAAARAASARPVAALAAGELDRLDALLRDHGTVLLTGSLGDPAGLPGHADRTVALVGDAGDWRALHALGQPVEAVVAPGVTVDAPGDAHVLRSRGTAWLGRHLTRTKLGLALGAGGAKGYAHVGALRVLEAANYTIDYVGGSSIGAIVGACIASGMNAAETEAALRAAFTPENVAEMFRMTLGGGAGLDAMERVLRTLVGARTFADLDLPLVVMTVDLDARGPAPFTQGPLADALMAATALPGMFPPYERSGQRLVDGLALVPVPTAAVAAEGADLTVSVNLLPRELLAAWPGEPPPDPAPERRRYRMLDTLLEVTELAQLETSVRDASLADVVVTPRFGPGGWRDFDLADRFLAAGEEAAALALPHLAALARPGPAA